MSGLRLSSADVLRYSQNPRSRSTVRRHYLRWRAERRPPMPIRCDNPDCMFRHTPLVWNCKPLEPILDHIHGNNSDNRPHKLRLLCPNCDAQLETRGGKNKGKVEKSAGGFALVRDGKRHYELPAETGDFTDHGQPERPTSPRQKGKR